MISISNAQHYKAALIKGELVLHADDLKRNVAAARSCLQQKEIMPGEKVIVFVSDELVLISVLWALLKNNISCIPLAASTPEEHVIDIAYRSEAACIITERGLAGKWTSLKVIFAEELFSSAEGKMDESVITVHTPYIFYNKEDNYQSATYVDHLLLEKLLMGLDEALSVQENDILLLSNCIPFHALVQELLWASSRGITVAIGAAEDITSVARYYSANPIEMIFSLFYFGNYVESKDSDKYKLLFDSVRFADEHQFKAVWTPERHFDEFGGLFPNPSVLSAALAVTTKNVQIRCGSIVAPLHHPVRIAEDWALIDNLSNGRVAISFASGWQCDDFIFTPEHFEDRHPYMMSQIEVVKRLWTGGKVKFKNGMGKEVDIAIFPKPVQAGLPTWVTVSGKVESFIAAGKIGANILTHLLWQDTDELVEKIKAYRKSLYENGFDPRAGKVSVMVHTFLGESNDAVKDKVREPLKHYIKTSTRLIQTMMTDHAETNNKKHTGDPHQQVDDEFPEHLMDELMEIAFNRFFDQAALLGTVEKGMDLIKKLKGYDVDEIAALIDFGLDRDDIMDGLHYLNRLKEKCNRKAFAWPATITHCSRDTLQKMIEHEGLADFLKAQRTILVEAGNNEKIPAHLLRKVRIIQNLNWQGPLITSAPLSSVTPLIDTDQVFNAAISSEF